MPRIVDHAARRREIASALWRVVRSRGVDEISVRNVAAEAGWSAGALRHYFATQDELFGFALETMTEQVRARLRAVLDADLDPFDRAVRLVEEFLPIDRVRRDECLVWVAFADRARLDAALGHIRVGGWFGTRHVTRIVVADLAGRPRPDDLHAVLDDPLLEDRARRLHVMIDGWTVQGVGYPDQVDAASLHADVESELETLRPRRDSPRPP